MARAATSPARLRISAGRVAILLLAGLPAVASYAYLIHMEHLSMHYNAMAARISVTEAQIVCCFLAPAFLVAAFWIRESQRGPLSMPLELAVTPFSPGRFLLRRIAACLALSALAGASACAVILAHVDVGLFKPEPLAWLLATVLACPIPLMLAFNPHTVRRIRAAAAVTLAAMAWAVAARISIFAASGTSVLWEIGELLRFGRIGYYPWWLGAAPFAAVCMASLPFLWRAWHRMFKEEMS